YSFSDVDLARLLRDAVETASVGQDEVRIRAELAPHLPAVRGDRERLRQENGTVRISVSDRGPGIPHDQQRLIFEKFGRAEIPGSSKPGTGLGLFIAR